MRTNEVDGVVLRETGYVGCCSDWPKPCPYHEGALDALGVLEAVGYYVGRLEEADKAWILMGGQRNLRSTAEPLFRKVEP